MISISRLYLGVAESGDKFRYAHGSGQLKPDDIHKPRLKKPVVVFNCTQRCNLKCMHCYSSSKNIDYQNELTTDEAKSLIDSLARIGSPVILFSGGEPLLRKDLIELMEYAKAAGLRITISTNGTCLSDEFLKKSADIGLSYIGVSLDGLKDVNDKFRGVNGAFDMALDGIRRTLQHGIKAGLRFTVNRHNYKEIDGIFDLMEKEQIPRICFYHLVYSGRGTTLINDDLTHDEKRKVLDRIIDRTALMHKNNFNAEVLTVDNHADGPYLLMRMWQENQDGADDAMNLMLLNGGNSSGNGIGCVSWDGDVYADQFSRYRAFGNIREKPFDEIWFDESNEIIQQFKHKYPHVTGKCRTCRFLYMCGGNLRARGEGVTGELWGVDPACYLTEDEISGEILKP